MIFNAVELSVSGVVELIDGNVQSMQIEKIVDPQSPNDSELHKPLYHNADFKKRVEKKIDYLLPRYS